MSPPVCMSTHSCPNNAPCSATTRMDLRTASQNPSPAPKAPFRHIQSYAMVLLHSSMALNGLIKLPPSLSRSAWKAPFHNSSWVTIAPMNTTFPEFISLHFVFFPIVLNLLFYLFCKLNFLSSVTHKPYSLHRSVDLSSCLLIQSCSNKSRYDEHHPERQCCQHFR
jgi:hypothetical protein